MTDCQCHHAGFCERHQVYKNEQWVHLCRTREDYRAAWDAGRGPGQTPPGVVRRTEPIVMEPLSTYGPGTELKRLLKFFLIFPKGGCDCDKHAMVMNQWGADRCLEKFDTIVGWLEAEAKKRHMPFVKSMAITMVKYAIHRAKRNELAAAAAEEGVVCARCKVVNPWEQQVT